MMESPKFKQICTWLLVVWIVTSPRTIFGQDSKPLLRYEGSSTLANFIREAEKSYGKATFSIKDDVESAGGEKAILEGRTDIAGVARIPKSEVLEEGVFSTLVGWDAIAVVGNTSIGVNNLSKEQLKGIFTGEIKNWNELGGPDLEIKPYIVDMHSATRKVFRSIILGEEDYVGCEVVNPDIDMIQKVRSQPGAIGHISLSFLNTLEFLRYTSIKTLSINGEKPVLTNLNYPITRPLYLLWWSRERVENFINWINTPEGQSVVQQFFIPPGTFNQDAKDLPEIDYVGSSTVGVFVQEASRVYRKAKINLNTAPESIGGEKAIVEGKTQLAGIAKLPETSTLKAGVVSRLIGIDAITIIVGEESQVENLTMEQLKGIFSGRITNWKEVGGTDQLIKPFIAGKESATYPIIQELVLGGENYSGCTEIKPDAGIITAVANNPGAIGYISMGLLNGQQDVKKVKVNGQGPTASNVDYPINRPLYLLWREGNPQIDEFIEWTRTVEAQKIILDRFIGSWVAGNAWEPAEVGKLILYTETEAVEDGGFYFYPYLPYQIFTPEGKFIKRVNNRLSPYDENPTQVRLAPGSYLLRPEGTYGKQKEFLVNIEEGETTVAYVEDLEKTRISGSSSKTPGEKEGPIADIIGRFKTLRFYGDFRFRPEQDWNSRNLDGSYREDRFRLRYRLRFGFVSKLGDHITFGARMRTGVPSNMQSPHNNFGYKGFTSIPFGLDKAYLSARKNSSWIWVGKNNYPFWKQNEHVWDDDVTPAGIALGTTLKFKKLKNLKVSPKAGVFIPNNVPFTNGKIDGTISGGQLELNYKIKRSALTLASSYLYLKNLDNVPETDDLYTGPRFKMNYQFVVSGLKFDFIVKAFKKKYPIALGLDHMVNLEDYSGDNNIHPVLKDQKNGYVASILIGKIKDKKDWLLGYYYVHKEELSVVSYYTEDDYGRWGNINRNRNTGYSGHEIRLAYAFGPKFNVVSRAYFIQGLVTTGTHTETGSRFRLDFNIKI